MTVSPSIPDKLSLGDSRESRPSLSFVIPCYNEEKVAELTIRRLLSAFRKANHSIEIIAVDNGSTDRTGEILQRLSEQDPAVVPLRVEVNQGYGYGLLQGIAHCASPWVCMIPADGQVDEDDVVRLYESVSAIPDKVLGKVRRRFRMDGLKRKFVSASYNVFVRMLWPRLASWDVNGSPKLVRREHLHAMRLTSKDWFLDAELMIKAHALGIRVHELNVFARQRGSGLSHVRGSTCWEFFRNLLAYRFSGRLRAWRRENTQLNSSLSSATTAEMASSTPVRS